MSKPTPWGIAQSQDEIAPGIVFYSTPSHGGIHLSPDRMREFKRKFPGFTTFAGGPWFEEDCDYAAVVLAFPEYFDNEAIEAAERAAILFLSWGHGRWKAIASPDDKATVHRFNESDCGGAFDGFTVTSDADPGL